MQFAPRVRIVTTAISIFLIAAIGVLLFLQLESIDDSKELLEGAEPVLQAIQHLLITVYEDDVVMEQYLTTTAYQEAIVLDEHFVTSHALCEVLADEVRVRIDSKVIQDEVIIDSYRRGMLAYNALQNSAKKLREFHKEELATTTAPEEREQALANYQELFLEATTSFSESASQMNTYVLAEQREYAKQQQILITVLVALLFITVLTTIFVWRRLVHQIAEPINEYQKKIRSFTEGEKNVRVSSQSKISEINQLGILLNNVFSNIKPNVQKKLLPARYAKILEFVKHKETMNVAVTMKDIRKEFNLTHPTVRERIAYLKNQGFVKVEKRGRNKYIFSYEE